MNINFFSAGNRPKISVVMLVGANRTGKTLLGNLLGSCEHVEHIDEPWILMHLTIMAGKGLLPESLAAAMFQTHLYELLNDRILMRHANFRPSDLSSIWRQKNWREIFLRLTNLQSRDDVRHYLKQNPTTLILTLTNTGPFCGFLAKAIPDCKIIYMIREGFELASEIVKKKWLSDAELKRPRHSNLSYRYVRPKSKSTFYLPVWVELAKAEDFLGASEYQRALYYWRWQVKMDMSLRKKLEKAKRLQTVRFSDLLLQSRRTFKMLAAHLHFKTTDLTRKLLTKIDDMQTEAISERLLAKIGKNELKAVMKMDDAWDLELGKHLKQCLRIA